MNNDKWVLNNCTKRFYIYIGWVREWARASCVRVYVVTEFVSVLSTGADPAAEHLDMFAAGATVELVDSRLSPAHGVSCTSLILHVHAEVHAINSEHLQTEEYTCRCLINPLIPLISPFSHKSKFLEIQQYISEQGFLGFTSFNSLKLFKTILILKKNISKSSFEINAMCEPLVYRQKAR